MKVVQTIGGKTSVHKYNILLCILYITYELFAWKFCRIEKSHHLKSTKQSRSRPKQSRHEDFLPLDPSD